MNVVFLASTPVYTHMPCGVFANRHLCENEYKNTFVMPTKGKNKSLILQFQNCRILRDHRLQWEDLWIRNGKLLNPEHLFYIEKGYADIQVDMAGAIIAPGFIDVQINGAFGYDFSVSTSPADALEHVAKGLLQHGVTSFCPTIISSPRDLYKNTLHLITKTEGSNKGAGCLGVHLEGPFINQSKKGAHPGDLVLTYDNGFVDVLDVYGSNLDNVAICTIAPNLTNTETVVQELVKSGVVVSVGHSDACLADGEAAVRSGASCITHLYNAMGAFHHRDPGLVGLLASNVLSEGHKLFYGVIADGIHTDPSALRIAHRTYPKGIVLVTDAMAAMGQPDGKYHIGKQLVEVKNNKATLAGTDILAGSIATMQSCVQRFFASTECTAVQALEAATLHPAQLLRLTHRKGTLDYGTDADLVVLDDKLNVLATYIAGEQVWKHRDTPAFREMVTGDKNLWDDD